MEDNPLNEVFGMWKDRPDNRIYDLLNELSHNLICAQINMELCAEDYHALQNSAMKNTLQKSNNITGDWFVLDFNGTRFHISRHIPLELKTRIIYSDPRGKSLKP